MSSSFKPLLAATLPPAEIGNLPWGQIYASVKLDGIRCLTGDGKALTRSLKMLPNVATFDTLRRICANWGPSQFIDGELLVGKNIQDCMHGLMSGDGEPQVTYAVFDTINLANPAEPFESRLTRLKETVRGIGSYQNVKVQLIEQVRINSQAELEAFEKKALADGYEGVMIRTITGPYKYGRSTLREGTLLKLKRFTDVEAKVIGFEQRMHNANEATKNELGHTKRSSAKAGMVPMAQLGALLVREIKSGNEYSVGSGFTEALRIELWKAPSALIGQIITVKYFDYGIKDVARFPVFRGFRDPRDMS
jgi:DNA ligase-1